MKVTFNGEHYEVAIWRPSIGCVADVIGYDTETEVIEDPCATPGYVLGVVSNGKHVYLVRRQDLTAFWTAHCQAKVYMHTAVFDIEVSTEASGFNFYQMVADGRIQDVSLYYRLLKSAITGDVPHKFNLALICREYLGVELVKDDGVRKDFGRFLNDGRVAYCDIPSEYISYAALDAISTFKLGVLLEEECRVIHDRHPLLQVGTAGTVGMSALPYGVLGHDIQLWAELALKSIQRNGIGVDTAAVLALEAGLDVDIAKCQEVLARYGYVSGKPGNQAVYDRVIGEIECARHVIIPVTQRSRKKSQATDDLAPIGDHEFVAAFLKIKELSKLKTTYLQHMKTSTERVHPKYTTMVTTGRTSCSSVNIQNIPRVGGVRECFVPSPGNILISCDYSALELCTLAQLTFARYGSSVMRDLINQGADLHRYVAARILGKPEAEVTKEERQKAKAIGFGLPGGMGVHGLLEYAEKSYGVKMSMDEATKWKAAWMALFPEMRDYLDGGDDLARLGATLDIESFPDASPTFCPEAAAGIVMRVAGGRTDTSTGRVFSPKETAWAWQQIARSRAGGVKALVHDIETRRGSRELQQSIAPGRIATIPTGRVRADCSYTESRNWPFQALAADGAKLALYDLMRAGYKIVAFIHDEVLVEVPESEDYRAAAEGISTTMVNAMRQVCPDVAIRTEYAVMRRWTKTAVATYATDGRLTPYEDRLQPR